MDFKFNDITFIIDIDKTTEDTNSYKVMSVEDSVNKFNDFIEILDEDGNEVRYTADKFMEVFDSKGLEGFIF